MESQKYFTVNGVILIYPSRGSGFMYLILLAFTVGQIQSKFTHIIGIHQFIPAQDLVSNQINITRDLAK